MKKYILVVIGICLVSSAAFAGGPLMTPSLDQVTKTSPAEKEKPKMTAVEFAYDDMAATSRHLTVGIGLGGNSLIGLVEKDGFGYPKGEFSYLNCVLGLSYTWYSGQPTKAQLKSALDSIKSKDGAYVNEKELPSLVRKETGIEALNYFEVGSWALIAPINLEVGTMWILNDHARTRLGFGLPTLISFGINWDF